MACSSGFRTAVVLVVLLAVLPSVAAAAPSEPLDAPPADDRSELGSIMDPNG